MSRRGVVALAVAGLVALPLRAVAQARVSSGAHAGPLVSSHPGPRAPRPSIQRPTITIGIVPSFPGAREHRPRLFRSSIFGLVAFDPYWWLAPDVGEEPIAPPPAMLPAGPPLLGGLQLDVEPRRALVYVDGILAGTVDQFSGYFQHLEAPAGYHVIEFLAPDYEPLMIGMTVVPNKTTTYRGFLNRAYRH